MPIPFLLAGLGLAAGVIGAGGHMSAKETNEQAMRKSQEAQRIYNDAKQSLENAQRQAEQGLLSLGYSKKEVLDTSMNQFLNVYDKIKHITPTQTVGLNELSKFTIDQQGTIAMRKMTGIYSSSFKSGAAGAATGAVIALAASGSLSIVTGGLATAGTALAFGEVGAAVGIAGSALTAGALMTPLAAVAAPVVLFTGISASMKADENLEKAEAMCAEAKAASEKMKISETLCAAICQRSLMFNQLLVDLNKMFSESTAMVAGIVRKKEGRIFKKKINSDSFSDEELNLIAISRSLAGAVKAIIDTPMLTNDGQIAKEGEKQYNETKEKLPAFQNRTRAALSVDYHAKPVVAKRKKR